MSATPLAPYAVASSRCLDLPGFRAHDPYPMRSPLVAADFLVDRLEAAAKVAPDTAITSYVEVGTRDGDNIACVAQLARQRRIRFRATAVEQSPRRCEALRARAAEALSTLGHYTQQSNLRRRLERGDALVGVELDQRVDEHVDLPAEHARHAGARHVAAMVRHLCGGNQIPDAPRRRRDVVPDGVITSLTG